MPALLTLSQPRPGTAHVPSKRRGGSARPLFAQATAVNDDGRVPTPASPATPTRRGLLASTPALLAAAAAAARPLPASAFTSADKGYSLTPPPGWDASSKPGADAFFTPPGGTPRGASLGVVVLPVRLKDLAGAGSLEEVGQRLVDAEKAKDGTLGVELTAAEVVAGSPSSVPTYSFEYVLATTRAFKTVVTATAVSRGRLLIVTGMAPCVGGSKAGAAALSEGGLGGRGACRADLLEAVRAAVASFTVEP